MNLTTVADRLGVYLIPFSAYALHVQLVQSRNSGILTPLYVVASSALLLVWMIYSEWATAWLPYKTWIQI